MTSIDALHRLTLAVDMYRLLRHRYDRNELLSDLAMAYDVPRARLALETLDGKM